MWCGVVGTVWNGMEWKGTVGYGRVRYGTVFGMVWYVCIDFRYTYIIGSFRYKG